jgi:O-antigen/teichoic acid export membrane protein
MAMPPSLLGVIADILLIPHFGAIAAAWVAAAVSAAILIACIAATRRVEKTGHDLRRLAAPCAIVAAYAGIASEWLPTAPWQITGLAVRLGSAAIVCAALAVILLPGNIRTVSRAVGR